MEILRFQIGHGALYGVALICNSILVSGTIFSPLKVDPSSMSIYKPESRSNDFEYRIVKRGSQDPQESADSKERRSQMGSSFIRFGRGRFEGNLENSDYASGGELDSMPGAGSSSSTSSRIARGRSDVIIRFGRADPKNSRGPPPSRGDSKFFRYAGKPLEVNDLDQLAVVCADADGDQLGLYLPKLLRLCNTLGLGIDESYDNRRKNKIIEFLEDASQAESVKHE